LRIEVFKSVRESKREEVGENGWVTSVDDGGML
jgi:hypothetical protein